MYTVQTQGQDGTPAFTTDLITFPNLLLNRFLELPLELPPAPQDTATPRPPPTPHPHP